LAKYKCKTENELKRKGISDFLVRDFLEQRAKGNVLPSVLLQLCLFDAKKPTKIATDHTPFPIRGKQKQIRFQAKYGGEGSFSKSDYKNLKALYPLGDVSDKEYIRHLFSEIIRRAHKPPPDRFSPMNGSGSKSAMMPYLNPKLFEDADTVVEHFSRGFTFSLTFHLMFVKKIYNDNDRSFVNFYYVVQNNPLPLILRIIEIFTTEFNHIFEETKQKNKDVAKGKRWDIPKNAKDFSEGAKAKAVITRKQLYKANEDNIEAAAWLFFAVRTVHRGDLTNTFSKSQAKRNHLKAAFNLLYISDRLRGTDFFCSDFRRLKKLFQNVNAILFIDPPYLDEFLGSYDGYANSFGQRLMARLMELIETAKAKIIFTHSENYGVERMLKFAGAGLDFKYTCSGNAQYWTVVYTKNFNDSICTAENYKNIERIRPKRPKGQPLSSEGGAPNV
jgi:site-specific DNA-adenine methylase